MSFLLNSQQLNLIVQFVKINFDKYNSNWNVNEFIKIMQNDKKNNNSGINFTLLKKIGKAQIDCICSTEMIEESLNYYKNLEF
jgi:3-dehydroquinate synthase